MASSAADAPSTAPEPLQIAVFRPLTRARGAIETWLEAERDQLPLWLPVALGTGIAVWFLLPDPRRWIATMLGLAAVGLAGLAIGRGGRASRAVAIGALIAALGIGLVWWRAERVAAPVLPRPVIATFEARVGRVEPLPARDLVRLTVALVQQLPRQCQAGERCPAWPDPALPPRFRLNLATADAPAALAPGAIIRLRARLMPPPSAGVPGAYDYARVAWFESIGATGRGFAPVEVVKLGSAPAAGWRERLSKHIQQRLPGSAGAIAATLATGDRGAIAPGDADAMRRAGLAHLLAISGLHVTAVVGAVMLVVLRLLALSPWLALRVRLPLVAAAAGAMAAVGYTLLTGAQVPTIRACVAAILILAAILFGREAVTLRLVAAGALVVLLIWPEALAGPSFQLSFAAVTTIVALHEHPGARRLFERRDEGRLRRVGRGALSLLLTGLTVELALAPIALYHFHQAGLYGALANIVAIPLTTFVVMPFEGLALLLDTIGLGGPAWWVAGHALRLLLALAHATAAAPGAVAVLPAMPSGAYGLIVAGGLWLALWRTRVRRLGLLVIIAGALWAVVMPRPDLLVTGDGRHIALRTAQGDIALLRERSGDYTRAMLAENSGVDAPVGDDEDPLTLDDLPDARCSRDACIVERRAGGRPWRIFATRSSYPLPIDQLIAACRNADIVVSDRRLPQRCVPHWLKLDLPALAQTGGVAITLATRHLQTVNMIGGRHPWRHPPTTAISRSGAAVPPAGPGRGPGWGHSAAGHRRGWRDRAAPSRLHAGNI